MEKYTLDASLLHLSKVGFTGCVNHMKEHVLHGNILIWRAEYRCLSIFWFNNVHINIQSGSPKQWRCILVFYGTVRQLTTGRILRIGIVIDNDTNSRLGWTNILGCCLVFHGTVPQMTSTSIPRIVVVINVCQSDDIDERDTAMMDIPDCVPKDRASPKMDKQYGQEDRWWEQLCHGMTRSRHFHFSNCNGGRSLCDVFSLAFFGLTLSWLTTVENVTSFQVASSCVPVKIGRDKSEEKVPRWQGYDAVVVVTV